MKNKKTLAVLRETLFEQIHAEYHRVQILRNSWNYIWIERPLADILLIIWLKIPDSKIHGPNMGPIWGRQDPCGPHVGPMNLVIWEVSLAINVFYTLIDISKAFIWPAIILYIMLSTSSTIFLHRLNAFLMHQKLDFKYITLTSRPVDVIDKGPVMHKVSSMTSPFTTSKWAESKGYSWDCTYSFYFYSTDYSLKHHPACYDIYPSMRLGY